MRMQEQFEIFKKDPDTTPACENPLLWIWIQALFDIKEQMFIIQLFLPTWLGSAQKRIFSTKKFISISIICIVN